MRLYSLFLSEKVVFHNTYRFVEGNMSLGTFSMILELNQFKTGLVYFQEGLITTDLLEGVLSLLEKVLLFFICLGFLGLTRSLPA